MDQQIPAFLPNPIQHTVYGDTVQLNNGKIWYSRYKPRRGRRAVPLGLIFTGINVIGGLAMKGVDVYNNYKRNSAMSNAMEVLIENERRLHDHLIRVEDNVGLVARTTATGFKQVNDGFSKLNSSLLHALFRVDSMMNTMEQCFRDTHDTLNNHHLAIHYLGKALAVVLPLFTRYKNMYKNIN